ncbi:HNH endonuclease [Sulfitobacter sp. M13]
MTLTASTPCRNSLPDGLVCGSLERRPRGNCAACHRRAAAAYRARKAAAPGSHTESEWLTLAATFSHCPGCGRSWETVERPNGQRLPFTKGHIVALSGGGSDGIENLRPECARCNYGGPGVGFRSKPSRR